MPTPFHLRHFSLSHSRAAQKVGTDGILLGCWAEAQNPGKVLDIGTGCGLIALMLAQRFEGAQILGLDSDEASVEEARENAKQSPWTQRVEMLRADFLQWTTEDKFDLIVSNPPYFHKQLSSADLRRNQARHQKEKLAEEICRRSAGLLSSGGHLQMIYPAAGHEKLSDAAAFAGLHLHRQTWVYGKAGNAPRIVLLDWSLDPGKAESDALVVQNNDNSYSEQYRKLTREFLFL